MDIVFLVKDFKSAGGFFLYKGGLLFNFEILQAAVVYKLISELQTKPAFYNLIRTIVNTF